MVGRSALILALTVALGALGCVDAGEAEDLPDKEELLSGKADAAFGCWLLGAPSDCDVCEEMGWYQDGSCDQLLVDIGVCSAPDPDCAPACFTTHIDDAIALNRARKPLYEAVSGGASRSISDALIRNERLTRVAALLMDDRARPWQRQGVPVLCDEFVSMELAPEFRERSELGPVPLSDFEKQNGARLALRLGAAWHDGGYDGLAVAVERKLDALAATPSYHCMLRHLLESTLRAARLAPIHEQNAAALGLKSTRALSREFIALQLAAIALATNLDEDAAPLQAQGIPIICQDVPPIPTTP